MELRPIDPTELRHVERHYSPVGAISEAHLLWRGREASSRDAIIIAEHGAFYVTTPVDNHRILRTLDSAGQEAFLETTAIYTEYLRSQGLAVPETIRSDDGPYVSWIDGHPLTVERYVGSSPPSLDVGFRHTPEDLRKAALLVAEYIRIAETTPKPLVDLIAANCHSERSLRSAQQEYWSVTREKIIERHVPSGLDPAGMRALDWVFKNRTILDTFACIPPRLAAGGKRVIVHGDIHSGNMLWTPEPIHLIDFESIHAEADSFKDIGITLSTFSRSFQPDGAPGSDDDRRGAVRLMLDTMASVLGPLDKEAIEARVIDLYAEKTLRWANDAFVRDYTKYFTHLPRRAQAALIGLR